MNTARIRFCARVASALLALASGCSGGDGCNKDVDCREGRICERGTCVSVGSSDGGVDWCAGNGGCDAHATCRALPSGGRTCTCAAGWAGNGYLCTAIDACATANGGCDEHADCSRTGPGTRTCACRTGYEGDGTDCSEIDACATDNGGCDPNADCVRAGPGLRNCRCHDGYEGNGFLCTAANPCLTNNGGCDPHADCTETGSGTRVCTCRTGYEGDGTDCSEIDACAVANGGCHVRATCTRTGPGTRTCACNPGWTGSGTTCADVNECTGTNPPCGAHAGCQNTPGAWVCSCVSGWQGNGTDCTDVDECADADACAAHANCVNSPGSYQCNCSTGYAMAGSVCRATWKALSAGFAHTCAIRTDGTLWCWGGNASGQLGVGDTVARASPVQVGSDTWLGVFAGYAHTCAMKTGGSLWCWGANDKGQLGNASRTNSALPVQTGSGQAWTTLPTGAAGSRSSCAIASDYSLWCWGSNRYGQVGDGSTDDRLSPVQIGSWRDWTSLAMAENHSCGLRLDGSLWCWGSNDFYQLTYGRTVPMSTVPLRAGGTSYFVSVAAMWTHTYAVRADGTLMKSRSDGGMEPVVTGTGWVSVAGGERALCAMQQNGSIYCQEAGFGTGPLPRENAATWQVARVGGKQRCGLLQPSGLLQCWGLNDQGQVGDGTAHLGRMPVAVAGGRRWQRITTGPSSATNVAWADNGVLYAWGSDYVGEAAVPRPVGSQDVYVPTQSAQAGAWLSVSLAWALQAGVRSDGTIWNRYDTGGEQWGVATGWLSLEVNEDRDRCALRAGGTLWCWGANWAGAAGVGTNQDVAEPTQVSGVSGGWTAVSMARASACALRSDNSLWCWGWNRNGQLGIGSQTDSWIPARVDSATDWRSVTVGVEYACALKTNDRLWCWGTNDAGQLGIGGTTRSLVPAPVGNAAWSVVRAGRTHACGVQRDGAVWCWGKNDAGQVGDGSYIGRTAPVRVGTQTWTDVVAGHAHSCALRADGTLWCWGSNRYGETGDGSGWRYTPVYVSD